MIQDDKKMVCIETDFASLCPCGNHSPAPVLNQTVTFEHSVTGFGDVWFRFKEFPTQPCGCRDAYRAKCFVPLDKHLEQFSISELLEAPKELELITA